MRDLPTTVWQIRQFETLRRIGVRTDHRHAQWKMTLREPVKPCVNHNFHQPNESPGNVAAKGRKDELQGEQCDANIR